MPNDPWRNPRPAPELADLRSRFPSTPLFPGWLRAWWPALLWAVVIFSASTATFSSENTGHIIIPLLRWLIPTITEARLDTIHGFIRKSAHFAEYFVFFLLLYRGLRGVRRGWHWSWAFIAWLVAAGYSVLDEIHQSFVASRGASPWDSLLDSIGAFAGLLVVFLFYRLRRSRKASPITA